MTRGRSDVPPQQLLLLVDEDRQWGGSVQALLRARDIDIVLAFQRASSLAFVPRQLVVPPG